MKQPNHLLLSLLLVAATAGVAVAAPELKYVTKATEPSATDKNPAPTVTVTVIGGPGGLAAESFTLKQADGKLMPIKASGILRYVEGPEPLGLVVLIEGDGRYLTGMKGLVEALEGGLGIAATAGPPGSQGLVLLYSDAVEVAAPAGPLEKLKDLKLAAKNGGGPKAGRDLSGALKKAMAELDKLPTPRKALLVIGDGIDGEGAKTASASMRTFATQLEEKKIAAFAVVLQVDHPALGAPNPLPVITDAKTGDEIPPTPEQQETFDTANNEWRRIKDQAASDMKVLASGNQQKLASVSNVDTAINAFVSLLDDRYYLTFPGYDLKTKSGVVWDGKEHPLMLRIDGNDTVAVNVAMTPTWSPPGGGGSKWWLFVVIPVGALVLIGGVLMVVKKPKPIPLPPPPPPVAAPPPREQVRQKTMFVSMDADSVFPMVGWVVFMNGPKRLKFHKIKQGVTKIGTAGNSDVVIDDGYMSTDHALIVQSPEGFFIQDNNSTNGTFLNDNKLGKKEELYDNDLILVGKTVLKFKAVM